MSPFTVVDLLKQNKIQKVKLFDADPAVMKGLMGSGLEVMVGIPNDMLAGLSSSTSAADLWVAQNVSRYMVKGVSELGSSLFEVPVHPHVGPGHEGGVKQQGIHYLEIERD
ncbi:hypothetical protein KY289_020035 [Solanum tuberosum]|nr:hypothetical protein KY289_020035 [Solanum tuberosum]